MIALKRECGGFPFGPLTLGLGLASFSTSPDGPGPSRPLVQAADLRFEQEPAPDASLAHVMKVTSVSPAGEAQKAGVGVGDLIHSINGYHTEQAGNLPWITSNSAPERMSKMIVRSPAEGTERTVSLPLP